jgi:hypothetical protein
MAMALARVRDNRSEFLGGGGALPTPTALGSPAVLACWLTGLSMRSDPSDMPCSVPTDSSARATALRY